MGLYMAIGSQQVLAGKITAGVFLATLNVYKDLGDRFEGVYKNIRDAVEAIEPLMVLTQMLNRSTDLSSRKRNIRNRRAFMVGQIAQQMHGEGPTKLNHDFWDATPILFKGVTLDWLPPVKQFSATIDQGSMVLVSGAHGTGKRALLNLITDH